MKKLIMILTVLSLALSLCACGNVVKEGGSTVPVQTQPQENNNDTTPVETSAPETEPAQQGYSFTYNGVEIEMNAPAADIIAALGEPKSYTEEASCAFIGMDKTYFYGSFYLQTYPMEDVDYIYCVWLVDDSVTTAEGIYIGATQAQVEQAYGAEAYNGSNAYILTTEHSRLTVILENGVVSSIQYDAII